MLLRRMKNASAFFIKTGSSTQWQADLALKEIAAYDMRNRRHVQPLLTWSTNAAHPVSLDQEPLQGYYQLGQLSPDLRRKIDLIQEFEMPDLSTAVKMTPIGDHILATGVYKPRVKCYDTSNLAIKFDRCMDSEVITFEIVSQSYDKLVFLQEDRYIELHNKPGRLDRFRIPFFGRDISIDPSTAMLYCVGNRPDIVRFNLDQGQFLPSLTSQASEINTCTYNPNFYYTAFGTREGTVEAWDPRARSRISVLDLSYGNLRLKKGDLPSVTSLQFDSTGLGMAVGTQTGHAMIIMIMLYDIRGGKPLSTLSNYMKPVIKTAFHKDYLLTLDETALQLWPQNALHGENVSAFVIKTGSTTQWQADLAPKKMATSDMRNRCHDVSPFLSLRSDNRLTDFCAVKDSGLVFLTGETQLMKVFFVPAVGPSPTWCHYLDNLIHELEEAPEEVAAPNMEYRLLILYP
ncbi:NOL10 [Cordylochernes scorpioides]|uniref:NOL10 n=1 Tax=Cordylochernes scorpioides TaxID=51811 RepID=A0ABY6L783_9ARAC|nr:NOL10 [Cordylochernes scorpioides]